MTKEIEKLKQDPKERPADGNEVEIDCDDGRSEGRGRLTQYVMCMYVCCTYVKLSYKHTHFT